MSIGQRYKIAQARLAEMDARFALLKAEHAMKMTEENARLVELSARIAELERDKERLDWLDAKLQNDDRCVVFGSGTLLYGPWHRHHTVRAAIDAAMKEGQP